MTFGPLRAGSYFYPVFTFPTGTSGVPPGADYQLHFTVGGCPTAACCYQACSGDPSVLCVADTDCVGVGTCEPHCVVTNRIECQDREGYWLAPPNVEDATATCVPNPCLVGSCCLGPGECLDSDDVTGDMDNNLCIRKLVVTGEYVGGAECENPVPPCPACEYDDDVHCQPYDDGWFWVADLSITGNDYHHYDDFVATEEVLHTLFDRRVD
jgi:hypothetical protein